MTTTTLVAEVIITAVIAALVACVLWGLWRRREKARARSVTVVVLGDIGRSPRMQYHALRLARHFAHVDLVGTAGELPFAAVLSDPRIAVRAHPPFPRLPGFVAALPRPVRVALFVFLYAPAKVVSQAAQLFWTLAVSSHAASHVLVQNPPSLPTLVVAWAAARLCGSRLVVDWHNLGHTLLAMSAGGTARVLVPAAAFVERVFGARLADAHLAVTAAMAEHVRAWGPVSREISIAVLRDRPHAGTFRPLSQTEIGLFLRSFAEQRLAEVLS
jgi:beta-1,4-mannosyltransferase